MIDSTKPIDDATIKYLSAIPTKKEAPFTYDWFLKLHIEMFGNVWDWAGKPRQIELSIGIKAYLVPMELKKLSDDFLIPYIPFLVIIIFNY